MPSSRSGRTERLRALTARPFAHRGLHGPGRVENSRAAFAAAIEAGHGIELDVQASAAGTAFVFHDDRLERLAEASGRVAGRSDEELLGIRLKGTGEGIPTLDEVLGLVAGRAPLLIEVKNQPRRRLARLCRSVAHSLAGYGGPVAVMSFNPAVGAWFARHAPHILRGLVVTEQGKGRLRRAIERALALTWSRADFVAADLRDLPSQFTAGCKARAMPVLTWTVRSDDDRARCAPHVDQIIYEAFTPR